MKNINQLKKEIEEEEKIFETLDVNAQKRIRKDFDRVTKSERLFIIENLKAKLQTLQEGCEQIQFAFNICSNSMLDIVKEKPRDNNTQRDWEQRIDELVLLYSSLNGLSNNESKELLLKKFQGDEE